MIIAKNDCTKIEIHETTYAGRKTLRVRSAGGRDRELDIAILEKGDLQSQLSFGFSSHTIHSELAEHYYENIKSSTLKVFGLTRGVERQ